MNGSVFSRSCFFLPWLTFFYPCDFVKKQCYFLIKRTCVCHLQTIFTISKIELFHKTLYVPPHKVMFTCITTFFSEGGGGSWYLYLRDRGNAFGRECQYTKWPLPKTALFLVWWIKVQRGPKHHSARKLRINHMWSLQVLKAKPWPQRILYPPLDIEHPHRHLSVLSPSPIISIWFSTL